MNMVSFQNVYKSYEAEDYVISDLTLNIQKGEMVALLGPSGCGKTTLLRMINRLHQQDKGQIYIKDRPIEDWNVIELRRGIGYVIQSTGLFPHLNIERNIAYVLEIMGTDEMARKKRAAELIELVGLDVTFLSKLPRELSGGQKQRVGVARALAADPELILMDEPFGAVDALVRKNLQDEVKRLFKNLNKTIVFVTHDIEEAFHMATRIVLLNNGKVEQEGTKEDLIFGPKNDYVAGFFGGRQYGAYLNTTKIKDITIFANGEPVDNSLPIIANEETLTDGIRVMTEFGVEKLNVFNSDNLFCGVFSLACIFRHNSTDNIRS